MIRVVVDTSVFVSAFIGRPDGGPAQVVQAIRERRVTLIASPQLIAELDGVLARPKFDRWAGGGRGTAYTAGLAAIAELRPDDPAPAPATRDPDDDYLVALAHAQQADVLVSLDNDLLDATTDVETVTPSQLLARLQ